MTDIKGTDDKRAPASRSRAKDATEARARPGIDYWAPSNHLEVPQSDDFEYRWVAEYVNGSPMPRRVHMCMREGYERVLISSLPEDFLLYEPDERGDGYTRYGGLILMRMPIALYRQRQRYYQGRSIDRLNSANELQGIAGRDAVEEDRGTRSLTGEDAGRALQQMSRT